MRPLSEKQRQILSFINASISSRGYSPSVREIARAVHLSSPSTVQRHLNILEEAGCIRREKGSSRSITLTGRSPAGKVPVLGRVAAGPPLTAEENVLGYVDFDTDEPDAFFALKIKGDSMTGAGILDGDTVVVRSQQTADPGDIVIALIGDEATCKRLCVEKKKVLLMPENDRYEPIDGGGAVILGRVAALIRNY